MKRILVLTVLVMIFLTSCGTSKKTQGAIIGGAVGATTGGLLTKKNRAVGIIIGAAVGGVTGGLIGSYMDKAARKIEDELGKEATVERIGEGIVVSFDSGLLFDFDSYTIKMSTRDNLNKLVASLKEFNETNVKILGHTDNQGTSKYNQLLSENRAGEVAAFLEMQGINATRLSKVGYGEADPVSSNKTDKGRELNRRVEIVLTADKNLKNSLNKSTTNN